MIIKDIEEYFLYLFKDRTLAYVRYNEDIREV